MSKPSRICRIENCSLEVPEALDKEEFCLNHYLEEAFQNLSSATEAIQHDQNVDPRTMDWLLAQVDFTVDWLAQDDADWDSDQRTKLLELLLGVANLNEHMRHNAVLVRPCH